MRRWRRDSKIIKNLIKYKQKLISTYFDFFGITGLSNELYYVREGVPNIYALQFTVPVPPHVDSLHFTWQSLGQKPVSSNMLNDCDPLGLHQKPTY